MIHLGINDQYAATFYVCCNSSYKENNSVALCEKNKGLYCSGFIIMPISPPARFPSCVTCMMRETQSLQCHGQIG